MNAVLLSHDTFQVRTALVRLYRYSTVLSNSNSTYLVRTVPVREKSAGRVYRVLPWRRRLYCTIKLAAKVTRKLLYNTRTSIRIRLERVTSMRRDIHDFNRLLSSEPVQLQKDIGNILFFILRDYGGEVLYDLLCSGEIRAPRWQMRSLFHLSFKDVLTFFNSYFR